jgi:hypothetical protein
MLRIRSTSPPKSAWPGVSTMLMRVPFHSTEVALARMVIPRSRSRSLLSIARSATAWLLQEVVDGMGARYFALLEQLVRHARLARGGKRGLAVVHIDVAFAMIAMPLVLVVEIAQRP